MFRITLFLYGTYIDTRKYNSMNRYFLINDIARAVNLFLVIFAKLFIAIPFVQLLCYDSLKIAKREKVASCCKDPTTFCVIRNFFCRFYEIMHV